MIIPNGTDPNIKKHKQKLGLTGDVYLIDDHQLESLESHKRLFPDSQATNIQEAEVERLAYIAEQARIRAEEAERQRQEEFAANYQQEESDPEDEEE